MKLLKQIRTAIFIIVALTAASSAGAETRHILERGETLESVAKKYGITTEQIIALNPDAKSFTYVGMELIIPETATTRSDSAAAASTGTAATPAPVAVSSGNTYSYTATPQTSASQTISQSAPYAPEPERTIFNMNASITHLPAAGATSRPGAPTASVLKVHQISPKISAPACFSPATPTTAWLTAAA